MPYEIIGKEDLNSSVTMMVLKAPLISKNAKAGQFVILKISDFGERIPLTISESDPGKGTITIIFQRAGTTTHRLQCMKEGAVIQDVLGPLGKCTDFGKVGSVVLVAGGVGIAEILPVARYAKSEGNRVTTIIGGRSKEFIILEEKLKAVSDEFIVTTDDGSRGRRGLVTDPLKELLEKKDTDLCYSVGPDIMMKAVCDVTKSFGVKTIVSLDANMVDATGMCGTCRVLVGGQTKFACVDGPEFDGHLIDWDSFLKRQKRFAKEEKVSLDRFNSEHKNCRYRA